MSKKTFSIISLGCFRNSYDSQKIKSQFIREGFSLNKGFSFNDQPANCDTLIVNTCGFIDPAKKESLSVINEALALKKKKKLKKIIVVGCLVGRYRRDLERSFPEVDEWRGVLEFEDFSVEFQRFNRSYTAFLKICEGCLNSCSFCTIPAIKGKLKSRTAADILKEVRYLNEGKIKELNLIGQDITSWGRDLSPRQELTRLLKEIVNNSKNISWIRLIYTHPRHFSDSLIELIAREARICKYIDLPIQHINDRILKSMNRKITRRQIINLITKIRKKIPNCLIRSSVIVGFPGETEENFKELLKFLKDVQFERLGAFIYSREEGTPAYNFKQQVHYQTKLSRYNQLMNQQKEISAKLNRKFIGQELDVLVGEKQDEAYLARTEFDAPEVDGGVFIKRKNLALGEFAKVKIVDAYDYDLVAI